MDFGGLLEKIKGSFTNPSILGNMLQKKQWNQDLPRFGGVRPEDQMIQNPNIVSPLQAPDEITPGLEYGRKLDEELANLPPNDTTPTPTKFDDVLGMQAKVVAPIPTIPMPTSTPVPEPRDFWDDFTNTVRERSKPEGYNADGIIRQKALESAFGTSRFAKERNNFGGIGAYDSNPNNAFKFDSVDDYLDYYFNLVKSRYPEAYENRADPEKFIGGLKAGGYASDPNYVSKVMRTPLRR